jgi:polysaccharide export outer membrane protein
MGMKSRIVGVFVYGAVLCAAQTGSLSSGESVTPSQKLAGDEIAQPAAAPSANPPSAPAAPPGFTANIPPPVRKTPADAKTPAETEAESSAAKYVIGPLDVLYVRVWNQPNLSGIEDVGPDGAISMPLIGEIKADGLTVTQLKAAITTRLNDYINSPEVSVSVTKINSKSVLIIGGVARPGKYPLNEKTTVLDALASGGGFRDFANQKKIYVLRGGKKFNFNYKEVIQGKHLEQNIELQNGDQIVVPE